MSRAQAIGAGGTRLAVREAGPSQAPPLLLLHGWAQSSRVWDGQMRGRELTEHFRVLAPDLRGHGDSEEPEEGYRESRTWADDVAALLAGLGRPAVLVGWSYGGLVLTDYLRHYGTESVAGVVFAGAITEFGRGNPGGRVGRVMRDALPAALSEDPAEAGPALREFVAGLTAEPLQLPELEAFTDPDESAGPAAAERAGAPPESASLEIPAQDMLDTALATPARVRSELFRREIASADVLAGLDVPVLVVHGERDRVVDPSAGRFVLDTVPGARACWYAGVGHVPFLEVPERFDADVAVFAQRVTQNG